MLMIKNSKGFAHLAIVISLIVLVVVGGAAYLVISRNKNNNTSSSANINLEVIELQESSESSNKGNIITIKAEVWADNWFQFYSNGVLVHEDSVPITTERSFNSETFIFEAQYPLNFGFVAKDYVENETGLEYIGSNRQQIGDGGIIAQFTNNETGELISSTDGSWKYWGVKHAPLDSSCAKQSNPTADIPPCTTLTHPAPDSWYDINFDDSSWANSTEYSEQQVSPKDGYTTIQWHDSAKFIWGSDLKVDNEILLRKIINQ